MSSLFRRLALLMAAAALAGGCAVGPDFKRPVPPPVSRFTPEPPMAETVSAPVPGGAAQRLVEGMEVPAQWWTMFGSAGLNELVAAALKANPDLQAAEAALRVARENLAAQRGAYYPGVDLHLATVRQQNPEPLASAVASGSNFYTLHTAQVNVSYVPDVFGGTARQVETSAAQAEVAHFQRHAVYLTLTSNIVAAAIQEASLRAQIKAAQGVIALATRQLEMANKLREAGQASAADVAALEAALAQTEAQLPPLEKQLAQQRDLLAILAGRFPSEGGMQQFELSSLTLPVELPLSLPSRLVEQRPDIRAAEAQLHAASAQVGVTIAARLPNITLSANVGSTALEIGKLFSPGTGFWSLGSDLAAPLFKGGTLLHQQRAAQAAYDQAVAQYRGTVLAGFQNVADTLHAIAADAKALRAAVASERTAQKSFTIAQRQWEAGAIAHPAVLLAEQSYQQAVIGLAQAQAARFADTVALYQALGGEWRNRDDLGERDGEAQKYP